MSHGVPSLFGSVWLLANRNSAWGTPTECMCAGPRGVRLRGSSQWFHHRLLFSSLLASLWFSFWFASECNVRQNFLHRLLLRCPHFPPSHRPHRSAGMPSALLAVFFWKKVVPDKRPLVLVSGSASLQWTKRFGHPGTRLRHYIVQKLRESLQLCGSQVATNVTLDI